jgi:Na+/proline symporter
MDIRWIIDFIRNNLRWYWNLAIVCKAILGDHIISADIVLGGISAVFWTLTLQTTIKYVIITYLVLIIMVKVEFSCMH